MLITEDAFRYRVAPSIVFTEAQLDALKAILDTYIAPLPKEKEDELVQKLKATHPEEQVRQFSRISSSSLQTLDALKFLINRAILPDNRQELLTLLSMLSTRPGTFELTGYSDEFKNLSLVDREKVILSWKDSSLPQMRAIYKTFHFLSCQPAYTAHIKDLGDAMHFNDLVKDQKYENIPPRFNILSDDQVNDDLQFDVIIIGSGAGGGVVASQLAQAGKSVLVIEKGAYYHESDFVPEEANGFITLYENGGFVPTSDGNICLAAGSVFGGGTTINWCASLKPQHFVREQWAEQGLPYFLSNKFSRDLNRVYDRIGATTDGIVHNKPNQVLIDGCKQPLGYDIADIPQNTSGKPHSCELCYTGCRAGVKNGSMNTWLRDAAEYGAKFLAKTKVDRVLIEDGKAVGVECRVSYDRKVQIKAKQVIVSAGSLQSPGVLLRSGLKNKNIGRHLKLHPASIAFGFFDEEIRCHEGSIMTAVSNIADNSETDGYGVKIEVPSLHPGNYSTALPWRGTAEHKELMLRYDRCTPIVILTRDKDSVGKVSYDKEGNHIVNYELSTKDRQSILNGVDKSLNILVAAGARELHTGQFGVEPFKFNEDEESSIINPRYIAWKEQVNKFGFPQEGSGILCAHQMGSNRMGISPNVSVVKPTGETWEVENLYVADASVFPTASGVNPMVTIEAICLNIADCILSKKNPAKL